MLRAFEDENVVGDTDPVADLETLELELVLADATTVSNNLEKRRRAAKGDKSLVVEVEALEAVDKILQDGTALWRADVAPEHIAALAPFCLLTAKRAFAVVNIADDQLDRRRRHRGAGRGGVRRRGRSARRCRCSSKPKRRSSTPPARPNCSKASASAKARCHASPAPRTACSAAARSSPPASRRAGRGRSAPAPRRPNARASSTPICNAGFIRAECIRWDELLELGSWSKAKDAGKLRVEGKDYVVQDGDVLEIRFNV